MLPARMRPALCHRRALRRRAAPRHLLAVVSTMLGSQADADGLVGLPATAPSTYARRRGVTGTSCQPPAASRTERNQQFGDEDPASVRTYGCRASAG